MIGIMSPVNRTFIIAEAGVNHNGSLDLAMELVDAAKRSGADAVKFQTFRAEDVVTKGARKAKYQLDNTGTTESQYEMLKALELGLPAHEALQKHCDRVGIEFLSTPADLHSLDLLVRQLNVPRLKISSADLTNAPLLLAAALTGKPIIISTGMGTLGDIEMALGVLAFGYAGGESPSPRAFLRALSNEEGQAVLSEKVSILHCTTDYPACLDDVNLGVISTLRAAFGLPVGYSDHTEGIAVPTAAVALGATVIEKHFTLDRGLPGPDHKASLEPHELRNMVDSIRSVERALGHSKKLPSQPEEVISLVARKSLTTLKPIKQGERFSQENLGVKRPGEGVSPVLYWDYIGTESPRDYDADEPIAGTSQRC